MLRYCVVEEESKIWGCALGGLVRELLMVKLEGKACFCSADHYDADAGAGAGAARGAER